MSKKLIHHSHSDWGKLAELPVHEHVGGLPSLHKLEFGGNGHTNALLGLLLLPCREQPCVEAFPMYCVNGKSGTIPVSLFWSKYTFVSAFKSAIPEGMDPLMPFWVKLSVVSNVKLAIAAGMDPTIAFFCKSSHVKVGTSADQSSGSFPATLLLATLLHSTEITNQVKSHTIDHHPHTLTVS